MTLVLAACVGLLMGLLGGGGSLLSVAVLTLWLDFPPRAAIAASLFISALTSTTALLVHRERPQLSARLVATFGGAGMLGAFAGGRISSLVPGEVLLAAFATVMLLTGVAMLATPTTWRKASQHDSTPRGELTPGVLLLALSIGIATGLLGAGGGFLIVPALVLQAHLPVGRAAATSLAVVALESCAGLLAHLHDVNLDWSLVAPFALLAALGSAAGSRLSRRVPPPLLQRSFGALVVLVVLVAVTTVVRS